MNSTPRRKGGSRPQMKHYTQFHKNEAFCCPITRSTSNKVLIDRAEMLQQIRHAGWQGPPVNTSVRKLFREVADVGPEERERILAETRISADLRAEVESLLHYDLASPMCFTRQLPALAQNTLQWAKDTMSRCGPYQLVRLLGSGGMGAVYLAERHDGEIEHKVAIKLLRADVDRPAWRERFLRERQLLASLNHPSIAHLLDAGHTIDGRPYLVMEYVDGVAIDEYAAGLDFHAQLRLFVLVCDGVSHAHRHSIIHRDLKPSNILVDSAGQPKLLDFGIAKLLDAPAEETQTVERLLTPSYASPEQLRGDVQTTATDIYSLGAVLYKLLTGRSPRELSSEELTKDRLVIRGNSFAPPSRLNPNLPRDLDYIVQRALRYEPAERYASVDALANDVRALLESKPVKARSADALYRGRKFIQRHRISIAAAAMTISSLLLGLYAANQQRAIAETRFVQVRQLANRVLALDEFADDVHNPRQDVHEIVALSKEYLEGLAGEARPDQGLALEIAGAYSVLARTQGVGMASTSERRTRAEESLRKADVFIRPILNHDPSNPKALLTAARISHDHMILAENELRNDEAVAEARRAAGYLNRLLEVGELSAGESEKASELFYGIALSHKNLSLAEEGIRYARLSIETARYAPNALVRLSLGLSLLADLLRITGDLKGALTAIREARGQLDRARFANERERRSAWCRILGREGKILGAASGLSLNRPDEAVLVIQKAFDLLEEWSQNEPEDDWSRLLFASLGREFGDILRFRDPRRALIVYDHALERLSEVENNLEARRGEVEILAGSAYALRRLNRAGEAKSRIETAFRLLGETKDYPADRIAPHSAAYEALRASGDHLFETGQVQQALKVYEDLLHRVRVSKPDERNDLRHALAFSQMYGSLAALYGRTGRIEREQQISALCLEMWRHWDRRLPGNDFVRRQLESASVARR